MRDGAEAASAAFRTTGLPSFFSRQPVTPYRTALLLQQTASHTLQDCPPSSANSQSHPGLQNCPPSSADCQSHPTGLPFSSADSQSHPTGLPSLFSRQPVTPYRTALLQQTASHILTYRTAFLLQQTASHTLYDCPFLLRTASHTLLDCLCSADSKSHPTWLPFFSRQPVTPYMTALLQQTACHTLHDCPFSADSQSHPIGLSFSSE